MKLRELERAIMDETMCEMGFTRHSGEWFKIVDGKILLRCGCYPTSHAEIGFGFQPLFSPFYYRPPADTCPDIDYDRVYTLERVLAPEGLPTMISPQVKKDSEEYDFIVKNGKNAMGLICEAFSEINNVQDLCSAYERFFPLLRQPEKNTVVERIPQGYIHTLLYLHKYDECMMHIKKYQELRLKHAQDIISRGLYEPDRVMRIGNYDINSYNNYIKLLERRDEAEIGELLFRCCAMNISLLKALGLNLEGFSYDFIEDAFPQALLWLY